MDDFRDTSSSAGVLYVLPRENFFSEGNCGRVSHALGVAAGLAQAGIAVTVLSGPGLRKFGARVPQNVILQEVAGGRGWFRRLMRNMNDILSRDSPPRHVLVRYAVSNGFRFARQAHRHRRVVWTFEVNSMAYHQYPRLSWLLRRFIRRIECQIISRMDLAYVVSLGLRDDLVAAGGRPDRVLVVPNAGPDILARRGVPNHVASDGRPPVRFVYFGVFHEYYRFDTLLDAFDTIRAGGQVELHLHGNGALRRDIETRARGRDGVFLHGPFELDDLVQSGALGAGSVLVLPCRDSPQASVVSPIKLFEYMAFGRPILASSVGQPGRILRHGYTAYLYDVNHADSCAAGMRWFMEDPSRLETLGTAARAEFLAHHTWATRMRDFYRMLERFRMQSTRSSGSA